MKKLIALLLALVMVVGLVACGEKAPEAATEAAPEAATEAAPEAATEAAPSEEPVTIIWKAVGTATANQQKIMDQINAVLLEECNAQLQFDLISGGEYDDKISMMVNAGDPWDIVFTCSWRNLYAPMIEGKAYAPITDLLEENAPYLYSAIDDTVWDAMKEADNEIYLIPYNTVLMRSPDALQINKQMADDAGITVPEVINNYDEMIELFKQLHAAYPDSIVNQLPSADNCMPEITGYKERFDVGTLKLGYDPATGEISWDNYISLLMPEYEAYHELMDLGIANTDITFTPDDALYTNGYIMSAGEPTNGEVIKDYKGVQWYNIHCGNSCIVNDSDARSLAVAFNSRSENVDKAIQVLDTICANPELARLLCYGIEGEDYTVETVDGNEFVVFVDGGWAASTEYYCNGPAFLQSVTGLYEPGKSPESEQRKLDMVADGYPSHLMGFSVDTSAIESELAACSAITTTYGVGGNADLFKYDADYLNQIEECRKELEAAGLAKVEEEINRQFAEFKAAKG